MRGRGGRDPIFFVRLVVVVLVMGGGVSHLERYAKYISTAA